VFKLFWEIEKTYDGSNLQYSLNNGTSWTNVGAFNDAVDCLNQNWYNSSSITNLTTLATVKHGWSGNIQPTVGSCQGGNGSNGWVIAKHCMSALAGQPSVIFRFTLGAGTTCNSFDGNAFDSVSISEAPINTADFNFACTGNTFSFTDLSSLCPNAFVWNFGDAGSGATNTASTQNASHTFSAPGTYNVTLTVSGPCNSPGTISKQIEVISATASALPPLCYNGSNGKAFISATTGSGPFTYTWSTTPVQTSDTAFNLSPGVYTVTVLQPNSCGVTATVTVAQGVPFTHSFTTIPDSCGTGKGSLLISEVGGSLPYQYVWSNGSSGSNFITQLVTGNYIVTITDANGCVDTAQANVGNASDMNVSLGTVTNALCWGTATGSASVNVSGGMLPYSYSWSPSGGSSAFLSNAAAGNYTVQISDATSCSTSLTVSITQPPQIVVTNAVTNATCGNLNGSASIAATGGTGILSFGWSNGATSSVISNVAVGSYLYTVTDVNSCTAIGTVQIQQSPPLILAATAVTDSCARNVGSISVNILSGTAPYNYVWQPIGTNQPLLSHLDSGTYTITVTDAANCTADTTVVVGNFGSIAKPFLGSDTGICFQQKVYLKATGYTSYMWQDGSVASVFPVTTFGDYSVTVTNAYGCKASDTIIVYNNCNSFIYFPTAFSPNDDGANDVFKPRYSNDLRSYFIRVYNRWGELVYESEDVNEGWNGIFRDTPQPLSVFVWYAEYAFQDGKKHTQAGNVTLMR
jgi:gliding motility-associated-like protein